MDKIIIHDLEVFCRVGVPDEERATPQRLLVGVEMKCDLAAAAASDSLRKTIDYHAVTRRLLTFSEGRSWRLIETLAEDIAKMVLAEFAPNTVSVEIKKFIIPEAKFVSVQLTRS